MKKKSLLSVENVLSVTPKTADKLHQNPRFPKKIKPVRLKYMNPTVRTMSHKRSARVGKKLFSTAFGVQSGGEPVRCKSCSMSFHNCGDQQLEEEIVQYGNVQILKDALLKESSSTTCDSVCENASISRKTSESGVQVNTFHCKDCRRHLKYGKVVEPENSCTESDSGWTTNESEECSFQDSQTFLCNHTCSVSESYTTSQSTVGDTIVRSETLSNYCEASSQSKNTKPQDVKCTRSSRKHIWYKTFRLFYLVLMIIPLVFYIFQTEVCAATITKPYFFSVIGNKEPEDSLGFPIIKWFSNLLFGVKNPDEKRPLSFNFF